MEQKEKLEKEEILAECLACSSHNTTPAMTFNGRCFCPSCGETTNHIEVKPA